MNLIAKIAHEEFHEKCTLQIIRRQVKDMATGQATHRVEVRGSFALQTDTDKFLDTVTENKGDASYRVRRNFKED